MPSGVYHRKPFSAEHRAALSVSKTGRLFSKAHRAALSASKIGKPSLQRGMKRSKETCELLRKSHLGQQAWNKGKKTGPPWNAGLRCPQLSRAQIGRPKSQETRLRLSKALKGRRIGAHIARNFLGGQVADAFSEVLTTAGYVREHMVFWGGKGEFFRLDFAHKEAKVNIELDGPTHYQGNVTPEGDRQRDQVLREHGWRIIRIRHGREL